MGLIVSIYNETLYRPLINLLVWIYNVVPGGDIGVSIILLTLFIRFILYPLSHKALKSQRMLQGIQPEIKRIQKKYKNKEEQARATMALYKEHNINPFSGCLPILIQFPLLIALYQVFLRGFDNSSLSSLYSFMQNPGAIDPMFLGLVNLANPNPVFALLAGFSQFLQSKTMFRNQSAGGAGEFSNIMSKQMTYIMPIFLVFIAWKLPSGLALYWIVTMLFSFAQQVIVNKTSVNYVTSDTNNQRNP